MISSRSMKNTFRQFQTGVEAIDYDIHGFLGLRVIGRSARDFAVIDGQLGQFRKKLDRKPDIIIHFEASIATGNITHLGLNAGFDSHGFYILSHYETPVKVKIPFDKIGNCCEILCETGLNSIPLLYDIINLTFLKKGLVPVHGSAFVQNGTGILVLGWAKGGKTEALLSFANHGAQFVGDECVILTGDGNEMFGLPVPVCLWDWQIEQVGGLIPEISTKNRLKFKLIKALDWLACGEMTARLAPIKILARLMPALRRQLKIKLAPEQLFKQRASAPVTIDRVMMMMSHSSPEIVTEKCHPWEIALSMSHSNEFELTNFFEYYQAFKFAFPQLKNPFLEKVTEIHSSILASALNDKETCKILHPHPVSLEDLYHHMNSLLSSNENPSVQALDRESSFRVGIQAGPTEHDEIITAEYEGL